MGTKNKPGAFDCYANAEPDEPMFVLLARDESAAVLVRMWCLLRRQRKGLTAPDSKEAEAQECAGAMERWLEEKGANSAAPCFDQAAREVASAGRLAEAEQCLRAAHALRAFGPMLEALEAMCFRLSEHHDPTKTGPVLYCVRCGGEATDATRHAPELCEVAAAPALARKGTT